MSQDVIDLQITDPLNNLAILCLGEPSISIYSTYQNAYTPQDIGIVTRILDGDSGRMQLLPESDLSMIFQWIEFNLTYDFPTIIIEGTVYAMQSQIGSALKNHPVNNHKYNRLTSSAYTVGLFDGFALWDANSLTSRQFIQAPASIDEIFLTGAPQAQGLLDSYPNTSVRLNVTGNPTLTSWHSAHNNVTQQRRIWQTLFPTNFPPKLNDILVVYAGGYGDGYNNSLKVFCDSVVELSQVGSPSPSARRVHGTASSWYDRGSTELYNKLNSDDEDQPLDYLFAFSPHPGYDPSYEAKLFETWGCAAEVKIISPSLNLSTTQVISASNVSLSQCSTTGGQSLSIGIPHAYVTSLDSCEDMFSSTGLIPISSNVSSLVEAITKRFRRENFHVNQSELEQVGVPLDGLKRMLTRLKQIVLS